MEIAESVPIATDFETELLAVYPALARRLAFIVHDWDEAEDLAQSAFARALERRRTFHGGDLRAWLYTIGIRLALNELRRRRRVPRLVGTSTDWRPTSQLDLWAALAELDPRHRTALVLAAIDGYTHGEIARMLGVRTGTVSSWLSRSKELLRVRLGDPND